ncbi:hypothetical protein CPB84DRAFT_1858392 [Gymnopilus junonius]|uniref:Uncharacterized protein n=1 Tax=Gymnopilus junonius TaxID=109634 RepID=A0A9P5N6I5_GYMJU|nr:hypothetical protein CPB84DRAFT_1858392 [Gymnopilus junonius]
MLQDNAVPMDVLDYIPSNIEDSTSGIPLAVLDIEEVINCIPLDILEMDNKLLNNIPMDILDVEELLLDVLDMEELPPEEELLLDILDMKELPLDILDMEEDLPLDVLDFPEMADENHHPTPMLDNLDPDLVLLRQVPVLLEDPALSIMVTVGSSIQSITIVDDPSNGQPPPMFRDLDATSSDGPSSASTTSSSFESHNAGFFGGTWYPGC